MNRKINFILNNEFISEELNPGKTLLDFIRKEKHLTGTKEGCREGDCGACTVLLGKITSGKLIYKTINSCLFPLGNIHDSHIVTIEGLNSKTLSPIQKFFIEEGASQCGFCTPGFIISLTGYLMEADKLFYDDAINAIAGNICRCTGYSSIKRVVKRIIDNLIIAESNRETRIKHLVDLNLLPEYFNTIESQLLKIVGSKNETVEQNTNRDYYIGGGTDLYVQKSEIVETSNLEFLLNEKEPTIEVTDNLCHLSGNVTFENFKNSKVLSKHFPKLNETLYLVASKPIRNSATLAGNIVNASPIGDLTIFLLALDAKLVLKNKDSSREIYLRDFYKGYKSLNKEPDEKIDAISFELPGENDHFNFEKVSKRTYLDIASVNTAAFIRIDNDKIAKAVISAGGVAPTPLSLKGCNEFLVGKEVTVDVINELLNILDDEIKPISDVRGSAEYKKLLLKQLIKAHFISLFPELITFEKLT